MIGETVVNLIFEYDNIKKPTEDKAVNRINILIREGYIDEQLKNIYMLCVKQEIKLFMKIMKSLVVFY